VLTTPCKIFKIKDIVPHSFPLNLIVVSILFKFKCATDDIKSTKVAAVESFCFTFAELPTSRVWVPMILSQFQLFIVANGRSLSDFIFLPI
jgi:hypothetical protein